MVKELIFMTRNSARKHRWRNRRVLGILRLLDWMLLIKIEMLITTLRLGHTPKGCKARAELGLLGYDLRDDSERLYTRLGANRVRDCVELV